MKFFATITLKSIIPVLLLVSRVVACPPDETETVTVTVPLKTAFDNACKAVTTIGGQADLKWFSRNVLSYYITKAWLTRDPPKGLQTEWDKIIKKCHKNTYNYCDAAARDKFAACLKSLAGGLMLKYGSIAMAYCPILDKKLENFETSGDKAQAMKFFTQYCQTKGKTC
ncbi:unnamed protein product [Mortierella alpina]